MINFVSIHYRSYGISLTCFCTNRAGSFVKRGYLWSSLWGRIFLAPWVQKIEQWKSQLMISVTDTNKETLRAAPCTQSNCSSPLRQRWRISFWPLVAQMRMPKKCKIKSWYSCYKLCFVLFSFLWCTRKLLASSPGATGTRRGRRDADARRRTSCMLCTTATCPACQETGMRHPCKNFWQNFLRKLLPVAFDLIHPDAGTVALMGSSLFAAKLYCFSHIWQKISNMQSSRHDLHRLQTQFLRNLPFTSSNMWLSFQSTWCTQKQFQLQVSELGEEADTVASLKDDPLHQDLRFIWTCHFSIDLVPCTQKQSQGCSRDIHCTRQRTFPRGDIQKYVAIWLALWLAHFKFRIRLSNDNTSELLSSRARLDSCVHWTHATNTVEHAYKNQWLYESNGYKNQN